MKSYEHYKEESDATASLQHLSIMLGASDLKNKKVALQRNMIADLKGALHRANLVVEQVKKDEHAQFKRAEKESKRASS